MKITLKIKILVFIVLLSGFISCDDGLYILLEERNRNFELLINPVGKTYSTDQNVNISCSANEATIYYTTDGSDPDTGSSVYSGPIPVTGHGTSKTIRAKAIMSEYGSAVVSESFFIDKGLAPTGLKQISNCPFDANNSSLVFTGSEFGLSWHEYRGGADYKLYFARLDLNGNKIGSDVEISDASIDAYLSSLVWTGSEYGVCWNNRLTGINRVFFARIDSSGNKIGSDKQISSGIAEAIYPSLVWTGSEYGVSWQDYQDGNSEIYFARIDASGNIIGSEKRITNDSQQSQIVSLVWTGSNYGLSWQDRLPGNAEIYFTRIDSNGNQIGSNKRITDDPSSSYNPSLVWTGSEYGVSWQDTRSGGDYEIFFTRIDSSGNKIGSDIQITNDAATSTNPSLVWTGTEYGVSWEKGDWEIYLARIDANGNKIGSDQQLTSDPAYTGDTNLVWAGTLYSISFSDNRNAGNIQIHFKVL